MTPAGPLAPCAPAAACRQRRGRGWRRPPGARRLQPVPGRGRDAEQRCIRRACRAGSCRPAEGVARRGGGGRRRSGAPGWQQYHRAAAAGCAARAARRAFGSACGTLCRPEAGRRAGVEAPEAPGQCGRQRPGLRLRLRLRFRLRFRRVGRPGASWGWPADRRPSARAGGSQGAADRRARCGGRGVRVGCVRQGQGQARIVYVRRGGRARAGVVGASRW